MQPFIHSCSIALASAMLAATAHAETPTAPLPVTPASRFIGPAELATYTKTLGTGFSMGKREIDPFGRSQDPNAKPIIAVVPGQVVRTVAVPLVALEEIVRKLVITTIMPGERRFLVGTRSFAIGDQVPLTFRGKPIKVEVMKVTSSEIAFRNAVSGEIAIRKLDFMPAGMSSGNGKITAPGMAADRPDAPIDLDETTTSPSLNR